MVPATALDMTFEEALAAARDTPRLALLEIEVERAEAALLTAGTYPWNPEVEIEAAERSGSDDSSTDRGVSLSQRLELGGKRGQRRAASEASLEAARAVFAQARAETLASAVLAFAEAVERREGLAIEEADAALARDFAEMVERRLEAGSATAIDRALAQAGLARAERGLARAAGEYRAAQARLAESVGQLERARVVPAGGLPALPDPPSLDEALAAALASRGDLAAASARIEAAEARSRLARALRYPDLTVAAKSEREEGDEITGLAVSVPLPLFNRGQGARAEAEVEVMAAKSERAVAELRVRREVAAAHGRLVAAVEARRMAETLGVTSLEEGLGLLERAFEAGKIGASELLLYRRELVEGRRQAVAAEGDVWEAAVALAAAAGGSLPGMDWIDEQETER